MNALKNLMEWAKESNPSLFWKAKMELAEENGCYHFDEDMAEYAVSKMYHVNSSGIKECGEHWTVSQARDVMAKHQGMFSDEDNEWDLYVALHIWWHDLSCSYKARGMESFICDDAITFFFSDDDFAGKNKVWAYYNAMQFA